MVDEDRPNQRLVVSGHAAQDGGGNPEEKAVQPLAGDESKQVEEVIEHKSGIIPVLQ